MRRLHPLGLLVLLACCGLVGTLVAGAAVGMKADDLVHLVVLVIPALALTVLATVVTRAALGHASILASTAAVAVVGVVVGIANLVALAALMIVSSHDATTMGVLLIYAGAAGVGAALAIGTARTKAINTLGETARRLGEGDLSARAGALDAGPEIDALATTLDEMAERLQEALAHERSVELSRRDLMTAISHDLRTPLSSLRAMVEAIDDGVVEDPPSLRRYTMEMRRSVTQLSTMVDDLFELAQLDAGAIEAETRRARLKDVVRSAVDTVRLQADEKGLALRADLGAEGETSCSPRLARILQNLLVNAVRHTPSDGTVLVEATRRPGELEVAVQDSGDGVDPDDLTRIFEPFYRADPARSGAGAGLGLALARRIAESMGGRLEVESVPRVGSRFCVRIPVGADG